MAVSSITHSFSTTEGQQIEMRHKPGS